MKINNLQKNLMTDSLLEKCKVLNNDESYYYAFADNYVEYLKSIKECSDNNYNYFFTKIDPSTNIFKVFKISNFKLNNNYAEFKCSTYLIRNPNILLYFREDLRTSKDPTTIFSILSNLTDIKKNIIELTKYV